jgi:transcriptional regulator with XRE-family HTH domain
VIYDIEQVGKRVKAERKKQGLTQMQLAVRSEISLRTLRSVEQSEKYPNLFTILQICKGLDISLADLFEDEDDGQ